jgi:hypothetical protein
MHDSLYDSCGFGRVDFQSSEWQGAFTAGSTCTFLQHALQCQLSSTLSLEISRWEAARGITDMRLQEEVG